MSSPTEYKPTKAVVAEDTMCCGAKRCANVQVFEDGSVHMDDEGQKIDFNPEQAKMLLGFLKKNLPEAT